MRGKELLTRRPKRIQALAATVAATTLFGILSQDLNLTPTFASQGPAATTELFQPLHSAEPMPLRQVVFQSRQEANKKDHETAKFENIRSFVNEISESMLDVYFNTKTGPFKNGTIKTEASNRRGSRTITLEGHLPDGAFYKNTKEHVVSGEINIYIPSNIRQSTFDHFSHHHSRAHIAAMAQNVTRISFNYTNADGDLKGYSLSRDKRGWVLEEFLNGEETLRAATKKQNEGQFGVLLTNERLIKIEGSSKMVVYNLNRGNKQLLFGNDGGLG